MADGARPGLDRPLGYAEALCAEFFEQVPCGLQVVAAARLDVLPGAADLRASAAAALRRHPVLSSVIERPRSGDAAWSFRPGPDRGPEVQIVTGGRWRDRYAAALTEPLDPSRALWRIELVAGPVDEEAAAVLLIVGHHAALDGVAAASLLAELVRGDEGRSPLPPHAAMEDLLDGASSLRPVRGGAVPGAGWPVERQAPVADRYLAVTTRELAAEVIEPVHRAAHREHTTVNAMLMALLCEIHDEVDPGGGEVGFNVPADVRARVAPPLDPGCLGAYFARPHVWATGAQGGTDRWARARDLEAAFSRDLSASLTAGPPWRPRDVTELVESLVDADRSQFDLAFLLTNLGVRDLGPAVTGLWFTTVQTAGVEAVVVSAASVAGRLQLTVAWPEPLLGAQTGTSVADGLVSRLTDLASSC